jgi:hypothetical protein
VPAPWPDMASEEERQEVATLLGREPQGDFEVVLRDSSGPLVLANEPLLDDGRPMPTRYWLVGRDACRAVGGLESTGGVRRAEQVIGLEVIADIHRRYALERDALIPENHQGPRPSGGVGGTRRGLKCLHAHYAWHLAGGDDAVGRWVAEQLTDPTESRKQDR